MKGEYGHGVDDDKAWVFSFDHQ